MDMLGMKTNQRAWFYLGFGLGFKFLNYVTFDRIYWSFWSCFSLDKASRGVGLWGGKRPQALAPPCPQTQIVEYNAHNNSSSRTALGWVGIVFCRSCAPKIVCNFICRLCSRLWFVFRSFGFLFSPLWVLSFFAHGFWIKFRWVCFEKDEGLPRENWCTPKDKSVTFIPVIGYWLVLYWDKW